ncbi:MAG: hypothetical protein LIP06_12765 [Tannerellaceae bacterium]|nr:hypothetical protein [Tannerellaceae bacterium]
MTILERKALFIQQILNDPDDSKFERLEHYYKTLTTSRLPGQETIEEMRAGVRRAMRDYKDGKKNFITHEELIDTFKK